MLARDWDSWGFTGCRSSNERAFKAYCMMGFRMTLCTYTSVNNSPETYFPSLKEQYTFQHYLSLPRLIDFVIIGLLLRSISIDNTCAAMDQVVVINSSLDTPVLLANKVCVQSTCMYVLRLCRL